MATEVFKKIAGKFEPCGMFVYYRFRLHFTTKVLGTSSGDVSIWNQHIVQKAKKLIKEANASRKRLSKELAKYKGSEFSDEKTILELQGIIRRQQQILGQAYIVPDNVNEILELGQSLQTEIEEKLAERDSARITGFLRDADGHAIMSSHMLIGNLKENLTSMVNLTEKDTGGIRSYVKSKINVGEILTNDVRPVSEFMKPDQDIMRKEDGTPFIFERPIRFQNREHGGQEVSIAQSEALPEGTEVEVFLRIRKESVILNILEALLNLGKNNGIGQNRRSGFGAYLYNLKEVKEEEVPGIAKVEGFR